MTLKKQVEEVLRDIPESRNSDITLTIEIWKRYYPERLDIHARYGVSMPLRNLYDLPREDNVKRIRAQFQSAGKYFPTSLEVVKQRKINEDNWRIALGYPPKNQPIPEIKVAKPTLF